MAKDAARNVRPARRSDVARLAELRHWYLAETARLEPRLKLLPEGRERILQAVSAWLGQEDREVLVAEGAAGEGEGEPALVGYATGLYSIWPPIFRAQRVGEVSECFVVPAARKRGLGRALLDGVAASMLRRGADVLRAPVPSRNDGSIGLFHALGFRPHLVVVERGPASR